MVVMMISLLNLLNLLNMESLTYSPSLPKPTRVTCMKMKAIFRGCRPGLLIIHHRAPKPWTSLACSVAVYGHLIKSRLQNHHPTP
jgi:hypothetical protein